MQALLDINDLTGNAVDEIWSLLESDSSSALNGVNVAWSFEGNGIRTRTTFLQAFHDLGCRYVELPNLLKTTESVADLAGYLDPFYDIYVIRESNHQRLAQFSAHTCKPVINAMSSDAHPCEVLTDGYYLSKQFAVLQDVKILLWGPPTNVFNSWHALAQVMDLNMTHYCPGNYHTDTRCVTYVDQLKGKFDVVITDAWPAAFNDSNYSLSAEHIIELGAPLLLPTPPVTVGRELVSALQDMPSFAGYRQKALLLSVQKAIIRFCLAAKAD